MADAGRDSELETRGCQRAWVALEAGDLAAAQVELAAVLAHDPASLTAEFLTAEWLARSGQPEQARLTLQRLVARKPDYPSALWRLSVLTFPGPHYTPVLAKFHEWLRPRVYLEIGVATGAAMDLAPRDCLQIGVDPAPCPSARGRSVRRKLYEETSDEFFARRTLGEVSEGQPIDLAFIDGMHCFEYALRDLLGLERWSHSGSVAVIHDALPVDARCATRERRTHFWTGDTWRILFVLRELRPDLTLRIVPTAPSGLLVVTGLDPQFEQDAARTADCVARAGRLDLPFYSPDVWRREFTLVDNDEQGWREALGTCGRDDQTIQPGDFA